jgi:hypothetical protein
MMTNNLAKGLVLVHTVLSIAAMTWASTVVLNMKDFGWVEPYRAVTQINTDGSEKTAVRYISEYDKSVAALKDAAKIRDLTYAQVKPAIESMQNAEQYYPGNHLFMMAELKKLQEAPGDIEVKRLKDGGLKLETPDSNLGKPLFDDKLDGVTKSFKTYLGELQKLHDEIDTVETDLRKLIIDTRTFTRDLTGTNEMNKYVQPGLYQLADQEFKTQEKIKLEIDAIKPHWSKAVEQARLFRYRYDALKAREKELIEFIAAKKKK